MMVCSPADAKLRTHQYEVKNAVTAVTGLLAACEASLDRLASQAPPTEGAYDTPW